MDGTAVEVEEDGTADRVALLFEDGSADSDERLLAKLPPRTEKKIKCLLQTLPTLYYAFYQLCSSGASTAAGK
jgi:hypothetical protein